MLPVRPFDALIPVCKPAGASVLSINVDGLNYGALQSGGQMLEEVDDVVMEHREEEREMAAIVEKSGFGFMKRTQQEPITKEPAPRS
jgi:hypothetical protein